MIHAQKTNRRTIHTGTHKVNTKNQWYKYSKYMVYTKLVTKTNDAHKASTSKRCT